MRYFITGILLAFLLVLTAGCSETYDDDTSETPEATEETTEVVEETQEVSIIQTLSETDNNTDILSEDDYKAECELMPASELTENADIEKGKLIEITGDVVIYYEQTDDEGKITSIIIAVNDDTYTLPSGKLPIYISYYGSTAAFINDTVTIYGEVYGYDVCPSPQIEETSLPRVDARYIEIIQ